MLVNIYERLRLSPFANAEEIRTTLDALETQVSRTEQLDQIAQVRRLLLTPENRKQYDDRLFETYPELKNQAAKPKPTGRSETRSAAIKAQRRPRAEAVSDEFKAKLSSHAEHVRKAAPLCTSEETTKQALILPMLDILGFSAFDPSKVRAEYQADFQGVKYGERVDYALFCGDQAVMYIEAKPHNENISNHAPQLARYFNSSPNISVCAITNGQEWRFFTDLENKNIMDKTPFLTLDVCDLAEADIEQLDAFRFDKFQPDKLRVLAEENVYLSAMSAAVSGSLKDVDLDFVRYIATKANIPKQLTQKFLESIRPLVQQAVENTLNTIVTSGLRQKEPVDGNPFDDPTAPIIDPDNPRIITTWNERRVLEMVKKILPSEANIEAKDTETYYGVLVDGKSNRWVLRYFDNKKHPGIVLPITLTEKDIAAIERSGLEVDGGYITVDPPENLLRISALIISAYQFCLDDENFRRRK